MNPQCRSAIGRHREREISRRPARKSHERWQVLDERVRSRSRHQLDSLGRNAGKTHYRTSEVSQPAVFIACDRNHQDRVKGVHGRGRGGK